MLKQLAIAVLFSEDAQHWYASPEWWLVILGFPTLIFIGWQAWEMRSGGEVTNRQLRHLISAERAWIQVPEVILLQKLSFITPPPEKFCIWLHPYVVNNGRTQARIVRVIARTHLLNKVEGSEWPMPPKLPAQPEFRTSDTLIESNIVLSPKQGINWIAVHIWQEDLERIKAREAFLYVYGRIDYMDISETERRTGFCKLYWIPYGNSDPVFQEDFIDSAAIPRTYTECT